jgi:hypothetical protein
LRHFSDYPVSEELSKSMNRLITYH